MLLINYFVKLCGNLTFLWLYRRGINYANFQGCENLANPITLIHMAEKNFKINFFSQIF